MFKQAILIVVIMVSSIGLTYAQDPTHYDIGTPTLIDLWVDPVNGDDSQTGDSATTALRTFYEAWNRVPMGTPLETGYHIHLGTGTYPQDAVPLYMESRYGSYEAPIIIEGQPNTVFIETNLNIFDTRYLYIIGLNIHGGGDAFHCERCDHLLLRDSVIYGDTPESYNVQEAAKFNQSEYIYLENNDISGAWNNGVDFVAVRYGHIINNRIHLAGDWCLYLKGGSAYFRVEGNEFYDCNTGGFSAGQGTGFEYMQAPWLQYEAYDIKFINNVVHDTQGAGAGVNGGYNILIANNVFYQIGVRSHIFEAVFGSRSCDGNVEQCTTNLEAGGWGTTAVGTEGESIPNRNVYVYNNIFYNPTGTQSQWSHFAIYAPRTASEGTNIANPVHTDDNLQIRGNLIWNGGADMPLGIESDAGCAADNPTCNLTQLLADNLINQVEPTFADPTNGDYTYTGSTDFYLPIPDFTWELPTVPEGTLTNTP